ncbi:hypothetical protein ACTXT7_001435 [Hymenolepis weldensis]
MGLDWIDELNLILFPDENETCQTPTLEPTNAENLVRGCNRCLPLTPEQPVIPCVEQRHERNGQDIIPHALPGFNRSREKDDR